MGMLNGKEPLRIAVLFQEGAQAQDAAEFLFASLAAAPDDAGLRMPVTFCTVPARFSLDDELARAERVLIILLADAAMTRRVGSEAPGSAWGALAVQLMKAAPPSNLLCAVVPVAVDRNAFDLEPEQLEHTSFVRVEHLPRAAAHEHILLQACVASLQLLAGREVDAASSQKAPVAVFLSHAKGDLPPDGAPADIDPVRTLLRELGQSPVDGWYDAKEIPPGGQFPEEIKSGVLQCSVLIAVITNTWTSREWCRREVLEAKDARRPLILVDHILDEKPRLFPYLGNAPLLRWKDQTSAKRIITYAIREALRYEYHHRALRQMAGEGDVVLGTKPELLTLSSLPEGTKRVIYPDPPLGDDELRELHRVYPALEITTPLSLLTKFTPAHGRDRVALSLSVSDDAAQYGGSAAHLAHLADDLAVFLMLAGFKLAYGGAFGQADAIGSQHNFTERLISIARSYSPRLRRHEGAGRPPVLRTSAVIQNFVAWPIHKRYSDADYAHYGTVADLVACESPEPYGGDTGSLDPDPRGWFPPDSAERRFAWTRGLSKMRESMRDAEDIVARVVLGGKITGYLGRYPGILEECLLDLRAKRPVFIIGTLGGAARLVLDALDGVHRQELTSSWVAAHMTGTPGDTSAYNEMVQHHQQHGAEMQTPEQVALEFATLGSGGLAFALGNGLDEPENRALSVTTDPRLVVELVVTGLKRLVEQRS